jgi:hypothetical protein
MELAFISQPILSGANIYTIDNRGYEGNNISVPGYDFSPSGQKLCILRQSHSLLQYGYIVNNVKNCGYDKKDFLERLPKEVFDLHQEIENIIDIHRHD